MSDQATQKNMLVLAGTPTAQAIHLMLLNRDQAGVDIQFTTFDFNTPKSYGNTLFVWKASGPVIPWNTPPLTSKTIDTDQYKSSQRIPFEYQVGLGYIVAYSVSSDVSGICASMFIPAGGQDPVNAVTSLTFNDFSTNYVRVSYACLDSYDPQANGCWVGLWHADKVKYDGSYIAAKKISTGDASGTVTIMDAKIVIGTTYSVGLFMGAEPAGKTALSAEVRFPT